MSDYPEWLVEKVARALVAGYGSPALEGKKLIWDVNRHDRIAAVTVLNELGFRRDGVNPRTTFWISDTFWDHDHEGANNG